ncbi:DUF899 family protein [Streptomyces nodosus]|uniref:DUF899 family protein n=1 Tax=Streptomyces nodosus TaxID=40318 RepID=UPI002892A590|nr:DUF899 family protein [Streptomyces nodosus]
MGFAPSPPFPHACARLSSSRRRPREGRCERGRARLGDHSGGHPRRHHRCAVFCQGPFEESDRYRRFMGWEMPWYSVPAESHERLLAGRHFGMKAAYLRDGDRVFETYWTTGRGVEPMAPSYGILDMTVHGRQETWEDSPPGWPQPYETRGQQFRKNGRPTAQWPRITAGHDDNLHGTPSRTGGSGCCP